MTRLAPLNMLLTSACLGMTFPVAADAYTARNRMNVEDIGGSAFEVVSRNGKTGARDYWCAAGEYATAQGLASNARIYLLRAPGPSLSQPGRKAVQFTTRPEASGITPLSPQLSLTVTAIGDNLSVALAREYCLPDRAGF